MEGLCDQEARQKEGLYLSLLERYHQHAVVYSVKKDKLHDQDICCVSKGGQALHALDSRL